MEGSAFGIIKEDFGEMLQKMNNERLGQMAKQIVSSPRNQEQFREEKLAKIEKAKPPLVLNKTPPLDQWKKCSICGRTVHPWQETSAEPLAEGIACVSCAIDRVDATRKNNGIPSHKVSSRNKQTGKWETNIVPDDIQINFIDNKNEGE